MGDGELRLEDVLGDVDRPYVVRHERLYTRDDLMEGWHPGADHSATLDGRIYRYVKAHGGRAPDMVEGLAQRLHDFFIDDALAGFLMENARPVVGIMGGSRTLASDRNYRRVVELAASLTQRGYLVVGGGGLGIMEAANLGAYLADRSDAERDDAVQELAQTPGYAADQAGYLEVAVGIRERFAPGGESLAIPTWVSEGEPISQFASHIAKYFSNSIREDGLLAVATAGIVFAPGRRRDHAGDLPGCRPERVQGVRPQPHGVPRPTALLRRHGALPGPAAPGRAPRLCRPAERCGRACRDPGSVPRSTRTPRLRGYAARRPDAHAQLPLAPARPSHAWGANRTRDPGAQTRDSHGCDGSAEQRRSWNYRPATQGGAPCSRPSSTQTTTATPEQYVAGLTDFGPGRAELFGNSADGYLKVHSMEATEADVTEGSSGVWERLRYDWSDPNRVVLTTTDSNAWGGASGHTYTFTRNPDGTTDIDYVVVREGKNLKGRFFELVFRTVGKSKLEKAFVNSVKAIEARNYEPATADSRSAPTTTTA